jgi:hypothetical protein
MAPLGLSVRLSGIGFGLCQIMSMRSHPFSALAPVLPATVPSFGDHSIRAGKQKNHWDVQTNDLPPVLRTF